MKTLIQLGLFSFVLAFSVSARTTYNFNFDWKLFVSDAFGAEKTEIDDSNWKSATLSRAWNKDIKDSPTGIAWYRKHIKLPTNATNLEFDGTEQVGKFYINGKFIGLHENGITTIGYDISDLLRDGYDAVEVRINNDCDYKKSHLATSLSGQPLIHRLTKTEKIFWEFLEPNFSGR